MNRHITACVITCVLVSTFLYSTLYTKYDGNNSLEADEFSPNLKGHANGTLGAIFEARKKQLSNACLIKRHKQPSSISESTFSFGTIVETRYKIIYCPVQKVASTFWRSILKDMLGKKLQHYTKFINDCSGNCIKNAVSLLVIRDPYKKLFSAYVDKLYFPRYRYWQIARKPINETRNNQSGSFCERYISFSDFIRYIIYKRNSGTTLNRHFTTIYEHCDPCKAKYEYIMKFENFKEEFNYIINEWNNKYNLSIHEQTEKISALNIASKHVNLTFQAIEQYSRKCNISVYSFILRAWRFFQITGVIPKEAVMPFSGKTYTTETVTREKLMQAVIDIISRTKDWERVKHQRQEALVQAYQTIDVKDIIKLRKIVRLDCFYFGYDENPDYLFERNSVTFNYFQWT